MNEEKREHPARRVLRFFKYDHLPVALQERSKGFHDLAHKVVDDAETNGHDIAETIKCLNKLLESKDCAARASL